MMQILWEIFAGTYNVRARAHHTREKPNARNIFKAVLWCIIKLNAFVVCCNSLFSAKLYFVIVCAVQGKEKLWHVVISKT